MSTMALDGVMPRARRLDPVTSVDAGRAADLHGSQAAVLDLMRGPYTWTQAELERGIDQWSPSRVRSAVSELVELGLVEWTGETRMTRYGRKARVYRAVAA